MRISDWSSDVCSSDRSPARREQDAELSPAPATLRRVNPDLFEPLLLGIKWMDPEWLLAEFGQEMFWVSIAIVFIECGLLFPILPGDSLLFSVGLFIHRAGAGEAGLARSEERRVGKRGG